MASLKRAGVEVQNFWPWKQQALLSGASAGDGDGMIILTLGKMVQGCMITTVND